MAFGIQQLPSSSEGLQANRHSKGAGDGLSNCAGRPWSQAFLNYNYDQGRGSRPLHGSKKGLWRWPSIITPGGLGRRPSLTITTTRDEVAVLYTALRRGFGRRPSLTLTTTSLSFPLSPPSAIRRRHVCTTYRHRHSSSSPYNQLSSYEVAGQRATLLPHLPP